MAGRDDRSALIALRELRAIEEQRLVDERQARIEADERRRTEEAARALADAERARAEAERGQAEAAARAHSEAQEERARREALAVDGARLRGELQAALERIAVLSTQPTPAPPAASRGHGWMLGCLLSTLAAFGLLMVFALRPPIERTIYVPKPVVIDAHPSEPPPPPIAAAAPAAPPPRIVRPPRPSREGRPATPPAGLKECDGDILCHIDEHLDDAPAKRRK